MNMSLSINKISKKMNNILHFFTIKELHDMNKWRKIFFEIFNKNNFRWLISQLN